MDIIKAHRKIVILTFPQESVRKPVVCDLARRFDLTFNILKAQVTPRREGYMTLELTGTEDNYAKGIAHLKEHGIKITPAAQKITKDDESCVQCGLCTAICPTDSMVMDTETRTVLFDPERCTACGMCTRVCPVRAIFVEVENGHW
ncbi:MAG: 4Fe-4S dicluster domain-containing protein [Desulfovibrio sp.]|nr:MAG: 4Fe-4S dicluster domain-containing protein [Desulfovibrio sp.]